MVARIPRTRGREREEATPVVDTGREDRDRARRATQRPQRPERVPPVRHLPQRLRDVVSTRRFHVDSVGSCNHRPAGPLGPAPKRPRRVCGLPVAELWSLSWQPAHPPIGPVTSHLESDPATRRPSRWDVGHRKRRQSTETRLRPRLPSIASERASCSSSSAESSSSSVPASVTPGCDAHRARNR